MSIFLIRGRKAPYQQAVGFSLENYLSSTTRAEFTHRLSEADDVPPSKRSSLTSFLQSDTLSVWGAKEKHSELFQTMSPGDVALFVDTRAEAIAHLMVVDGTLGEESPRELRRDLSQLIWREPSFENLWFSETPIQRPAYDIDAFTELIQTADPGFTFPSDWFTHGDDFHRLDAGLLDQLGGQEAFLETLRSGGVTERSPDPDGYLLVNQDNLVTQGHWSVAAKFTTQTGIDGQDTEFEAYKHGHDPRIRYHLSARTRPISDVISGVENNAEVLIKDGNQIVKQGRLATVEGKYIDGEMNDMATIFEVRETPAVPVTEILAADRSQPLDPTTTDVIALQQAEYERFLQAAHGTDIASDVAVLADQEPLQASVYREAAAHLVAGRNVIFYGPPGTGKTRAATRLADRLGIGLDTTTANAEWSNHDVVGGYKPAGPDTDGDWKTTPGFLSAAALTSVETLTESGHPHWLLVDEINRANLDQAFGNIFTLLDIDYRQEQPITFGDQEVLLPYSFRLLATMNTSDRSKLFSLGYAFRRRFAFVHVPSLLTEATDRDYSSPPADPSVIKVPNRSEVRSIVTNAVRDDLTRMRELPTAWDEITVPHRDAATVDPGYGFESVIDSAIESILTEIDYGWPNKDPLDVTIEFMQLLSADELDIVEIGQALAIDVLQYLVASQLLAEDDIDRGTVDNALVAYVLPQIDVFMADLRKEETIQIGDDRSEDAPSKRYQGLIDWADENRLVALSDELSAARDSYSVL